MMDNNESSELLSPLSRPLPPSPLSPLRPPVNRMRKRRGSVPEMVTRPIATEAIAIVDGQSNQSNQSNNSASVSSSTNPFAATAWNAKSLEPVQTDQGNQPYGDFARRYYSVPRFPEKQQDQEIARLEAAISDAAAEEIAMLNAYASTSAAEAEYLRTALQGAELRGVLQKRSHRFPYGWTYSSFQCQSGQFSWGPSSAHHDKDAFSTRADAVLTGERLHFDTLPPSGLIELADITGVEIDAPSKLVQYECPGDRYVGTARHHAESRKLMQLSVDGCTYELLGAPYLLQALQTTILNTKQMDQVAERAAKISTDIDDAIIKAENACRSVCNDAVSETATTFDTAGNAFVAAVEDNDITSLKDALDRGADVNMTNSAGDTALSCAVKCGDSHLPITELLLRRGASLRDGERLIRVAKKYTNVQTERLLHSHLS